MIILNLKSKIATGVKPFWIGLIRVLLYNFLNQPLSPGISMTLKGNLKEFSFIQLLNLINLAKKSGALYIERLEETCRIIFREGKLAFAETSAGNAPLLNILHQSSLISTGQKELLSERLKPLDEKAAGIYVISAGYVTQQQIISLLIDMFSEIVRGIFTWEEGFFRFEAGELIPDGRIPVQLNLENLIVEGARKLHEIEELKAEIPSLDMALKFTDRPAEEMRDFNLSAEEWHVINYVNPKNSIQQIAAAVKMDDLEIRRVVYTLLQAGLVEIIRPDGIPLRLSADKMFPTQNPGEQKSLVNRLINRIRSI